MFKGRDRCGRHAVPWAGSGSPPALEMNDLRGDLLTLGEWQGSLKDVVENLEFLEKQVRRKKRHYNCTAVIDLLLLCAFCPSFSILPVPELLCLVLFR